MKKALGLLLLCLSLLMWGCAQNDGSPEASSSPLITEGALYVYAGNQGYGILDENGDILLPLEYDAAQVLYDNWNGEPSYLLAAMASGENGENYEYQLFDLEGNFIRDLEGAAFLAAGDALICYQKTAQPSESGEVTTVVTVINGTTGEVLYDPCQEALVGTNSLILRQDDVYTFLNEDGEVIAKRDDLLYLYNLYYNDLCPALVAADNEEHLGLLDSFGKEILPCTYQFIEAVGEGYAVAYDGVYSLIELETGEMIAQIDQPISYYNGQCLAISENDGTMYLADIQGQPLSAVYESLYLAKSDSEEVIWVATDTAEDGSPRQILLDNTGQELLAVENCTSLEYVDGSALATLQNGDSTLQKLYALDNSQVLLSTEDGETYGALTVLYSRGNSGFTVETPRYLLANVQSGENGSYDVLDPMGKPILTGMTYCNILDDQHFLVELGSQRGIMDAQGVWLYQENTAG